MRSGQRSSRFVWASRPILAAPGETTVFLEAVLGIARTGCAWRDLPPTFGNWNTVFKRYRDWVKAGELRALGIGTLVGAITTGGPGGDIELATRSS